MVGVAQFKDALFISSFYLMIPVDKFIREFFIIKTKRNPSKKDVTFVIDILLFSSVVIILFCYMELSQPDPNNPLIKMFDGVTDFKSDGSDELFIMNTMNSVKDNTLRFDYLLAFLVGMTWLRTIFYFRGY